MSFHTLYFSSMELFVNQFCYISIARDVSTISLTADKTSCDDALESRQQRADETTQIDQDADNNNQEPADKSDPERPVSPTTKTIKILHIVCKSGPGETTEGQTVLEKPLESPV